MDNFNIKKNKALPYFALLLVVAGLIMGSMCSFAEQSDNDTFVAMNTSLCLTTPYHGEVDGHSVYVFPDDMSDLLVHNVILHKPSGSEKTVSLISINGYSYITITIDDIQYYVYFSYEDKRPGVDLQTISYILSQNPITDGHIYSSQFIGLLSDLSGHIQATSVLGSTASIINSILDTIGIVRNKTSGAAVDIIKPFTLCQYTEGGEDMTETNIVTAVLAVFSSIGDWFADIIPSMLGVFYSSESGLTILGTLAVCSLAIAVVLLVLAWILDFFKFRR